MINIGNQWDNLFENEQKKAYYTELRTKLLKEYRCHTVYPAMQDIFAAFRLTDYEDVKAVIIGQDPYHNEGQAHGLCFSVQKGVEIPPSLVNIYKELNAELGCYIPNNGDLSGWARQGVLLLNAVLTVREGLAGSHRELGWETFTDSVISHINQLDTPVVYLLLGNFARSKKNLISAKHYILEAAHPSPLSAYKGFFGCGIFAKTNQILDKIGRGKIDWQINNI